ncbi:hypothetical protein ACP26L_36495 (plasmid) [Paenibacillus sp. S-38]|uniref:hypothetical protein n=1 Tax=Paenibacillus sp. S-38 TaxID=3416710 RepID=UPI003CEFA722
MDSSIPSKTDIVITRLGMPSGLRINRKGQIFIRGQEIRTDFDSSELYEKLMSLIVDHHE